MHQVNRARELKWAEKIREGEPVQRKALFGHWSADDAVLRRLVLDRYWRSLPFRNEKHVIRGVEHLNRFEYSKAHQCFERHAKNPGRAEEARALHVIAYLEDRRFEEAWEALDGEDVVEADSLTARQEFVAFGHLLGHLSLHSREAGYWARQGWDGVLGSYFVAVWWCESLHPHGLQDDHDTPECRLEQLPESFDHLLQQCGSHGLAYPADRSGLADRVSGWHRDLYAGRQ